MLTILATDGSAGKFTQACMLPHMNANTYCAQTRTKDQASALLTAAAPTAACAAGLQIHTHGAWEDVPIIPGTFIINLGGRLLHSDAKTADSVLISSLKPAWSLVCEHGRYTMLVAFQ